VVKRVHEPSGRWTRKVAVSSFGNFISAGEMGRILSESGDNLDKAVLKNAKGAVRVQNLGKNPSKDSSFDHIALVLFCASCENDMESTFVRK